MKKSDPEVAKPINFYDKYSAYSDSQIKEILKNHKDYQELAVAAAIKIGIERGLIHSEQDLLSSEYQNKTSFGFSFFPLIKDDYQRKKVVTSIFRVLFLLSLIPVIFGTMKYTEGQLNMTYIGVGLGLLWLLLTYLLLKTNNVLILISLIVILVGVLIGLSYRILMHEIFHAYDFIVLASGTLLPIYFLLYLKKLNQTKSE